MKLGKIITITAIAATIVTTNAGAGHVFGHSGSSGNTWSSYGNKTYGSNGTTWSSYGNKSYGTNSYSGQSKTCSTYGSKMYCS
jgi:hypothetical protein